MSGRISERGERELAEVKALGLAIGYFKPFIRTGMILVPIVNFHSRFMRGFNDLHNIISRGNRLE